MYTSNNKRQSARREYEEEYRMMCEEPIDDTFDMGEEQQYYREACAAEYRAPIVHPDECDW